MVAELLWVGSNKDPLRSSSERVLESRGCSPDEKIGICRGIMW